MTGFWQALPSALAALLVLTQCSAAPSPPEHPRAKPRIQLMTSLPLVWGENASMESILSGEAQPAPIYRYWQGHYALTAVDSLESLDQDDPDLVILAQPRAMDPADLTILDAWVRAGGDVIILTDPDLLWPSDLPFGDPRRPLASGLLSPLLAHWGLQLVADAENRADAVDLSFGGYSFVTRGIGRLQPMAASLAPDVQCEAGAADFLVKCSVGDGRASIVADADFLNAALWPESAREKPQDSGAGRFVDSLVEEHVDSAGNRK